MITTIQFAEKVGRQKMASALQVLPTAVSNAVVRGTFPPSWFKTCTGLANAAGIPCPPELFSQRPFHNTPSVDCRDDIQGQSPKAGAA